MWARPSWSPLSGMQGGGEGMQQQGVVRIGSGVHNRWLTRD